MTDCYRDLFTPSMVKHYMRELLTGLHFLHTNGILHQDIKGDNILVDNEGHLKIAGFGKSWYACEDLTGNVTNYRPQEILMGSSALTVSVDIWSAACTFARIITGKHIFEGDSEIEVLSNIFRMCGTPNEGNWSEGLIQMGFEIPEKIDCCLRSSFVKNLSDTKTAALVDKHAIDLFEKMLVFDPEKRISALDALHHPYFITAPLLSDPKSIPRFPDSHSGFRQKDGVGRKMYPSEVIGLRKWRGSVGTFVDFGL